MFKVLLKWYYSCKIGYGAFVMWLKKDSTCNSGLLHLPTNQRLGILNTGTGKFKTTEGLGC